MLANARTVAFFPPDACLRYNPALGPVKTNMLHATCGPLMSTLERAAQHARYEVVPWQSLRGDKPPVELARAANVDVLFLIDELDLGTLPDAATRGAPTFFERSAAGADSPLEVSPELARECHDYAAVSDVVQPSARTAAIGIQTISVVDGHTRWRYRDVRARTLEARPQQVTFASHGRARASPLVRAMGIVGVVALGSGLGAVVVGEAAVARDKPTQDSFDTLVTVGTVAMIGGALLTGGAIALYVHQNGAPSPEQVLCNGRYAAPAEPAGARDTTAIDQTLRDEMIAPFVDELTRTHTAGN